MILTHRQVNFIDTIVHKDNEGRFILVNGMLDGIPVSFVNVYAPNEDQPSFVKLIFNRITEHSSGILLIDGDFNRVMSQQDREPLSKTPIPKMGKVLKYLSAEAGLVDVWRSQYPKERNYTFYSNKTI